MSMRVMGTLSYHSPHVEVYSIDEAFLGLGTVPEAEAFARRLRRQVRRETGIPVSVGLARTKTLAKLANRTAKKRSEHEGVFDLTACADVDGLLDGIAAADVWGIGRQYAALLERNGIHSARQLRDACDRWVKRHLTVVGLRTVYELRGIACIPLDGEATRRSVMCSRTFAKEITHLSDLREAVAHFASQVGERLRRHRLLAGSVYVFVTTGVFSEGPHYSNQATVSLPVATAYTPDLIRYAHEALGRLYRAGYAYEKAGVMALDLVPEGVVQTDLFAMPVAAQQQALMGALDRINTRYGRGMVFVAATGINRPWSSRQVRRSPRYTTRWDELLNVRA
jgi:DNA polymerase V